MEHGKNRNNNRKDNYRKKSGRGSDFGVGVPHRYDRDTEQGRLESELDETVVIRSISSSVLHPSAEYLLLNTTDRSLTT